jgi:hypothetical protein
MSQKFKIGDIVKTGRADNGGGSNWEITPLATNQDLSFLTRYKFYLFRYGGRQPSREFLKPLLESFDDMREKGKLIITNKSPKQGVYPKGTHVDNIETKPKQIPKPKPKPKQIKKCPNDGLYPKQQILLHKDLKKNSTKTKKDDKNKILNPKTGRYVSKTGKIGKILLSNMK